MPVEVRPARADELPTAIRIIIASFAGRANEQLAADFLQLAKAHQSDLGGTWVATQNGQLVSAVLPVLSPGRTMLIFPPVHLPSQGHEHATRQLIEHVCLQAHQAGVHLVQALLDNEHDTLFSILQACSFKHLAELLYLQAPIPPGIHPPSLPPDCQWHTYSPQTHNLFAQTILATYQNSLDCPGLNGLRHIDDIVAGHKATGEFDPSLWFVLAERQTPLGVLLLSHVPASDVIELVYLGVPYEHRGRGTSDLLMRQAAHVVSVSRYARLSLAVDAGNLPALKLYWRHGLQAIARKFALMRDLRVPVVTFGPAVEQWKQSAQGAPNSTSAPDPR
ncbi:MAG: GNAT family N-acetyltransferase [Bacillota bacterium]